MPHKPWPLEKRFWKKVNKNGPIPEYRPGLGPCWIWLGGLKGDGYGSVGSVPPGKSWKAHRASYEMHKGPIPKGLTIDHLCRVRSCVNPDHLEAVTMAENKRRGFSPAAILARRSDRNRCLRGHLYRHETDHEHGCTICRVNWLREKRAKSR